MCLFRRPDDNSDATLFIEELKRTKPQLDAQQGAGRAQTGRCCGARLSIAPRGHVGLTCSAE